MAIPAPKRILRKQSHLLGGAFLLSVFVNLLMLTGPLFMLQVYDRVLVSRSEETLVALISLVVALYGFMWVFDSARSKILGRLAARLQTSLDGPAFKASVTAKGMLERSTPKHLETVQNFVASPALTALMDAPFSPLFLAAIYIFHPQLGMLALAGGVCLTMVTAFGQWSLRTHVATARQQQDEAQDFAEALRQSTEFVQAQGLLPRVRDIWADVRQRALEASVAAQDRSTTASTLTKSMRLALQSLMLALGAWLVLRGELTAGAMIAASILLGRALAPIEQLLGRWTQCLQARQSWAQLNYVLAKDEVPEPKTRLPRPEGISMRNATYATTPGGNIMIFNINFEVAPGEALGIIGRSGAGKTTLARMMTGCLAPTSGEVRLGGALLSHYQNADLGQHIGYLPQDTALIPGTLAQNIARFDPDARSEDIVSAAKAARAHDLIQSLPDGYDTRIIDPSGGLSGGQRQRVALARAVFGQPAVLVLDEPNSALDAEGSTALNAAIKSAKSHGQSVIIMTHRPSAISECDRLLMLEKGRVAALGPRDSIVKAMMENAAEVQATLTTENVYGH